MPDTSNPILQSLLLADHLYKDGRSGKYVVCGIFNTYFLKKTDPSKLQNTNAAQIELQSSPSPGSPFAYLSITEFSGKRPFELRWVSLTDHSVLMSCKFDLECDDPIKTLEVGVELPRLPMKLEEGVYALELLCDDFPLGSHRVTAKFLEEPGQSE